MLTNRLRIEAPVVGMNVQHLQEAHPAECSQAQGISRAERNGTQRPVLQSKVFLHDFEAGRLKFSARVASREWEILCIPAIPVLNRPQAWLAKLRLTTQLTDGRRRPAGFFFLHSGLQSAPSRSGTHSGTHNGTHNGTQSGTHSGTHSGTSGPSGLFRADQGSSGLFRILQATQQLAVLSLCTRALHLAPLDRRESLRGGQRTRGRTLA